jgi:hypothetical protein
MLFLYHMYIKSLSVIFITQESNKYKPKACVVLCSTKTERGYTRYESWSCGRVVNSYV